jgi:hypothetical protein
MLSKDWLGMAFAEEMIVLFCGQQPAHWSQILAQEPSLTFTLQ